MFQAEFTRYRSAIIHLFIARLKQESKNQADVIETLIIVVISITTKSTFVDDLEKSDWTFVDSLDDINEIVNKWCVTFSESANKHATIKTIDLRKAFDTVDHTILQEKSKSIGFSTSVLVWFTSYLSNRTQVTTINNSMSTPKPVTVGVPKGSILGPLLFLFYINDLPECLRHCKSIFYADDTLLYYSADNISELQSKLNHDKTKLTIFAGRQSLKTISNLNITIYDRKID